MPDRRLFTLPCSTTVRRSTGVRVYVVHVLEFYLSELCAYNCNGCSTGYRTKMRSCNRRCRMPFESVRSAIPEGVDLAICLCLVHALLAKLTSTTDQGSVNSVQVPHYPYVDKNLPGTVPGTTLLHHVIIQWTNPFCQVIQREFQNAHILKNLNDTLA